MVEAVGKDTDQQPFAGELGRLRQIQLAHGAESGVAADILMTGVDPDTFFLHQFQKFLMFSPVFDPHIGIVVDPRGARKW